MFIDTHAHIEGDVRKYIDNAKSKNVMVVINASEDYESSINSIKMARENKEIYACIGVHPLNVNEYKGNIKDFYELALDKRVVAIGEIGLDYHYSKDNKELQKKVFREFLELAENVNKPVVIHMREATMDTINILSEYNVKGVIHAFSGSLETANILISMGFLLGVGGVLTFKNSKLYEVIEKIPIEKILLETDAPYLTPHPYRGQKNESAYIPIIASSLANYKKVDIKIIEEITTSNAKRIFDI